MRGWLFMFILACVSHPVLSQYKLKVDSAGMKVSNYELIYAKPFHSRGRYALRYEKGALQMEVFLSNARIILPRTGSGNQDSLIFHSDVSRLAFSIPVLDSLRCHPKRKQFRFLLPLGESEIHALIDTPPSKFTLIHGDQHFDFNIGIAHYTRMKNRIKWILL